MQLAILIPNNIIADALRKEDFPLTQNSRDPWEVLAIAPTADPARIREAYLVQVRLHHPDQFRLDPQRYHRQEEYMKTINEAYRWALEHPAQLLGPDNKGPRSAAAKSAECPVHLRAAIRQCKRCHDPICLACTGFRQSLCDRHYQMARYRQARRRALKEWGPLILIVMGLRLLAVPSLYTAIAVLIYIAWLGLVFLLDRKWFGCLAFLLLPYSLVLAGVWSLFESLREWNHPPTKGAPS